MNIRTNSVVNKTDTSVVNAVYGTQVSTGVHDVKGTINVSGIATVGFLTTKNVNIVGIVTATTFIGDGSQLVNVPSVSAAKSIALKLILADPPLRC